MKRSLLYKTVSTLVRIGTEILCRIDEPDINKIPAYGPLIGYANHTGQIEIPILFGQLQPRPITAVAKIEVWDNAFLRWVFNFWGVIPIRRGESDASAMRKSVEAVKKGMILGISPEGTRSTSGKLQRAYPGVVTLALLSGAPLIPVAHWGGKEFRKNLVRLKRTDFHIRIGNAIRLKVEGVRMTHEVRQQIVDEMMYRLAELLPEELRGEYADMSKHKKVYTEECEL